MNVLIRINFSEDTKIIYLNEKGINNLNKMLKEKPFFNIISPKLFIQEWLGNLAYNFSQSGDYNARSKNYCQLLTIMIIPNEIHDFNKAYESWSEKLKILVGQNGLEEVIIKSELVKDFINTNTINLYQEKDFNLFINFIEKQKLNELLEFDLKNKKNDIKNKI